MTSELTAYLICFLQLSKKHPIPVMCWPHLNICGLKSVQPCCFNRTGLFPLYSALILKKLFPSSLYSAILNVSFHNEPEKTKRESHLCTENFFNAEYWSMWESCAFDRFFALLGVECVKCIIVLKWPLYCILWSCMNRLCALFSTTTEVNYACEEQQYLNRVSYTDFEASLYLFFCLDWTTISTVKVLYYATFRTELWTSHPCN